jgi:tetratricopeptide (TPR) repeat protein
MEKQAAVAAAKPEPVMPAPPPTPAVVAAPKPAKPAVAPVAAKPRRVAAATPVAAASKSAETAKPESGPAADPDKLIKDAQQAWFRGQYAAAVDSARKALRIKPGLGNAYQIIAVCSCALHDESSAQNAYEKLDERNKLFVKTACQKNGVKF